MGMKSLPLLLALALAGGGSGWTPDEMLRVKSVGDVQVSPDGRRVAFTVSRHSLGENVEPRAQIWVMGAAGSDAFQLTRGEKSAASPRWSPDGRWIAFLRENSGRANIWRIRANGGEAEPLTSTKAGVAGFKWSHSGRWIAYGAPLEPTAEDERRQREKEDWQVVGTGFRHSHLWVIPADKDAEGKREPRLLTPQEFHLAGAFGGGWMDWSPDDRRIVIAHMPQPRFDDWRKADISEVQVEGRELRRIAATEAAEDSPVYSPDGRWIAYRRSDIPPHWGITFHIWVAPVTGGSPRELALTYNEEPTIVGWTADGAAVIVLETRGTSHALYQVPLDGPAAAIYDPGEGSFAGVTLNQSRSMLGLAMQGSAAAPEAFISPVARVAPRQVSHVNEDVPKAPLGKTRAIRSKSSDGLEIEGLLTYPSDYKEGRRAPLLVISHGGPPMAFTQTFIGNPGSYPIAAFAERGYAVLRSNVRGSAGYGRTFRYANYGDWGGGDFRDMMAGVDHVIAMGVADPERLGIMGWSYGGFMTAWAITQTHRFKAASIGAPVTDLVSLNGTADMATFVPDYFGGESWEKLDAYIRHSPVVEAKCVVTPSLMQHGTLDTVVPLAQGQEFYNALVRQGVEARMILYPRSGHGLSESKFVLQSMRENLAWFEKYLSAERSVSR